jgi:hypothetical protein
MTAGLLAAGLTPVRAHDKEMCPMCSAKMDVDQKADKLDLLLGLSDKQKSQVETLLEAKKKKLEPAMEQMKSTYKQACDDFDAGVKKILTADQQKKFDQWKDLKKD